MQTTSLAGSTLGGRYHVIRDLGEESLGRTYVASDERAEGRLVQIKAISASVEGDAETFARFGREISASLMVSHPNTVEVIDYGQQGELRYLVSEWLTAAPLSEALGSGPLPVARVAHIAAQVAAAVGAAHQEGIVHRALSPDTVLLLQNARSGDYAKVADFGLSKISDGEHDDVTRSDVRVGRAAYMAPEYIQSGTFEPKGDLYALGCLMFEAVAGVPPYQGERSEVLERQVSEPPPSLRQVAPNVPSWFASLVEELLHKDPEARPGVRQVIRRLEDGQGRALAAPELLPLTADGKVVRTQETSGSMPLQVAGVAAVAVLGGAILLAVFLAALVTILLVLGLP
ncbi:MAG: serine/threonine protein kinase [Myxococcales bacterium]|nr:serine/threonine protein kinase [Myxococcales bacterium]